MHRKSTPLAFLLLIAGACNGLHSNLGVKPAAPSQEWLDKDGKLEEVTPERIFRDSKGRQVWFEQDTEGLWKAHIILDTNCKDLILPVVFPKGQDVAEILNSLEKQGTTLQKQQIHVLETRLYKRDTGLLMDRTQVVCLGKLGLMGGGNASSSSSPWDGYLYELHAFKRPDMHAILYRRRWETARCTSGPFIITHTTNKPIPYRSAQLDLIPPMRDCNRRIPPRQIEAVYKDTLGH